MSTSVDTPPCVATAEDRAAALVAEVATRIGVPVPRVTLRDKPGGAACVRHGELHLGTDLLHCPPEQARAVVAHELAHLHYADSMRAHLCSLLLGLVTLPLLYAGLLPSPLDWVACAVTGGSIVLTASRCRRREARADRFAARTGHGPGLRAYLEQDQRRHRPWLLRVAFRVGAPASTHPRHRTRMRSIRTGELMSPLQPAPDTRMPAAHLA